MSRFYALALRPWVEDDGGGHWALPPGSVGAVDLAPVGGKGHVFVTSEMPFDPDDVATTIGDGTRLDSYVPTPDEQAAWETLIGVAFQPGWTLLDALWATLTAEADPDGVTRAKPIMPTHKGVLELHLGGHSLIRAEKLPADPTTHPAWPNIQRVLQNSYRAVLGSGRSEDRTLARKWLGAQQLKYRLSPEAARDLMIPADLPREMPLRPTTTITDDFNRANTGFGEGLGSSPEGWSWTTVSGDPRISSTEALIRSNTSARAESALSSADQRARAEYRGNGGTFSRGGLACRFSGSAKTYYTAGWQEADGNVYIAQALAGEASVIDQHSISLVAGDTLAIVADGSSISVEHNGSTVGTPVTNTAIEQGLRTGFGHWNSGGTDNYYDSFEAADLLADAGEALVRAVGEALGLSAARHRLLALARTTAEPEGAAEATARPRSRARRRAETQGIAEGDVVARALARLRSEAVVVTETTSSIVEALAEAVVRVLAEPVATVEAVARPRHLARIRAEIVGIAVAIARVGGFVSAAVPAISSRIRMRVETSTRMNVPPARR